MKAKFISDSLNESSSRYCGICKAENDSWYLDLAHAEYGDSSEASRYGPFSSFDKTENYLSDNFSNPGSMYIDDSGKQKVPTKSLNGRPIISPTQGGRMLRRF
jgi:hypothetical protein